MLSGDAGELLGPHGPFAKRMRGFVPRAQQRDMARAVERALADYEVLVCEAGTGTGKTLAYLCPVVLSGRKTIISTGTKNLQAQLYHRDLPAACASLGLGVHAALLKGRANYLCLHRLRMSEHDPGADAARIAAVAAWARETRSGDVAECTALAESDPVWPRVTSTVENCLGAKCEFFERCYVVKARRAAVEAELVVINHHLFFADMALREEGFGEILPGAHAVIFDEAHQLPEVATRFFGTSVSSAQLRELGRDTLAAYLEEAGDYAPVIEAVRGLDSAATRFRSVLGEPGRSAWAALRESGSAAGAGVALEEAVAAVVEHLAPMEERGQALEGCYRRALEIGARLATLAGGESANNVCWVEAHARGFAWHSSPLEIGPLFSAHIYSQRCAWVFTSATLAVDNRLEHFAGRLGLSDFGGHVWESPFDFATQSLCYLPPSLPNPNDPAYTSRLLEAVIPVLEASRGRAFFLFTSHHALERARSILAERTSFPLLAQGTAPREELLRRFGETPRAVLLGTSSFWEGVDVKGAALSCVIIDRLPFAVPDDPVLQARARAMREEGRDPFRDYQLPQAVLSLKQGVGRLIRDETDYGLLVLCDPRLATRGYASTFWKSLPAMPTTTELADVERFFEHEPAH